MKTNDIILIASLLILSIIGIFVVQYFQRQTMDEDGIAIVVYKNQEILRLSLGENHHEVLNQNYIISIDSTNRIYVVEGTLGPVTIQVENNLVNVIDQTSPQNICQLQRPTNSPLAPLTCLPNDLIIRIEASAKDDDVDAILQ